MRRLSIARVWPMRRKNFHATSLMMYVISGVMVFSQFALSRSVVTGNSLPSSGTWALKEIRVFNTMDGSVAAITSEQYDARGGSVDINISGNVLGGTCPGGSEKIRFTWRFHGDVSQVANGGAVSANLHAGQVSRSENCRDAIAQRSTIAVYPSSGTKSLFSSDITRLIDGDRFHRGNGFTAYAAGDRPSGVGSIEVNTHAFIPGHPLAYFSICIITPTASGGGRVNYTYLYEHRGGDGGRGARTGWGPRNEQASLNGTNLTYYRGSTADQCQADCTRNENCKAFTFIRAGAYNAADPPMCYLISEATGFSPSPCCISAIKNR
jgi:hypothetical protein